MLSKHFQFKGTIVEAEIDGIDVLKIFTQLHSNECKNRSTSGVKMLITITELHTNTHTPT